MVDNNVQNIKFLRNGVVFVPSNDPVKTARQVASDAMNEQLNSLADGTAILGRYKETDGDVKTLVGFAYISGNTKTLTVFDVDGASANVDEKIKTAIQALNSNATSKDGKNVQVKVTETDGKITAVNITDNTVNSDDVNTAITNAINKLDASDSAVPGQYVSQVSQADGKIAVSRVALPDASSVSGASKVIIDVTQDKGAITASAANLSGVKLDGYSEAATTGDVASTDTLGEALGKLQKTIHEMDKPASAEDGKVVTTISENDGVVSEKKVNVKDLQLGGYSKDTSATGAIASTDTVNEALSKLENKAAAITIANADKSINVTTSATGTDINVNINSDEKVIKKDGNGGLYTNIAISAATSAELATLGTNVQEAYKLVATNGTKLGEFIKIYKDSSLVNLYLGNVDDLLSGTTAQTEESESSVVVPGSGREALVWIVQLADGKYKLAAVDVESFLQESEFKYGLQVSNHEVSVKVDSASEAVTTGKSATANVLSVSSEGVKVGNIQAAIDYKVSTLDATVGSQTVASGNHVAVEVVEADGVLTALTVIENDIASDSALTAEIAARKAVDGQSGDTYAANANANYIGNATTLNDADIKLDAALKVVDNAMLTGVAAGNGIIVSDKASKSQTISAKVNGDGGIVNDATGLHLGYIDAGIY